MGYYSVLAMTANACELEPGAGAEVLDAYHKAVTLPDVAPVNRNVKPQLSGNATGSNGSFVTVARRLLGGQTPCVAARFTAMISWARPRL